jgi:hypothetical protein
LPGRVVSNHRVSLATDNSKRILAELADHEVWLGRLKPVDTGYNQASCCMKGTRESLLGQIITWATNNSNQKGEGNTLWIYGLPGIGKTSLAHSICQRLHDQKHLAGAFFCRRNDPDLSEPRNILPTLIYKLARIFTPFRRIVVECLRNDPHLSPESMKHSLFFDFIDNLPLHPSRALVFVIDALDECGDNTSRPALLRALTDATTHAPWLRIIITSRLEDDIQYFFKHTARSSYSSFDLATDQEATGDLRSFAQNQFNLVARSWCLPTPWPEESLFDRVISRANGFFIFIKTVVLALESCADPTETLEASVQDSAGTGLESLYQLYSSILKARIVHRNAEFRQTISVLLTTAPYRPLCEDTIAELAGVRPHFVKKLVNDLSSLLYRDEKANGGVRVRHVSISDFLVSDGCNPDYRIHLQDANMHLGIACLRTMVVQLRFNICKLEDSRLANAEINDLQSRIEQNISDPLQYSSLYWSNHICSAPDNHKQSLLGNLKEFFYGLYPLFWVEVLSLMGMVPTGARKLRRLISWINVSTASAYS